MTEIEERIYVDDHDDALDKKEFRKKCSAVITNLWRAKGWEDDQLFFYITQRFGRSLDLLSLAELNVIKDEFALLIKVPSI